MDITKLSFADLVRMSESPDFCDGIVLLECTKIEMKERVKSVEQDLKDIMTA